jgi:hypothetical protein
LTAATRAGARFAEPLETDLTCVLPAAFTCVLLAVFTTGRAPAFAGAFPGPVATAGFALAFPFAVPLVGAVASGSAGDV